ncbi:MAG: phosphomannomutase/phosphoglucomutase [Candidatus Diapherotrites archaeon]
MKLNPSIFREYDVRGLVDRDLSPEIAELIAKGFAAFYFKHKGFSFGKPKFIVARDNRPSSESYAKAVISGLLSSGIEVIDVSVVPVPLFYFAIVHFKADGGIIVTGSHNPPEFNGFKMCIDRWPIFGKQIQEVKKLIEAKKFRKVKENSSIMQKDIIEPYLNELRNKFYYERKLKVVVDAGNGTAGIVAPRLLRSLGFEVVELYCEPDGTFPNHLPDPVVKEYVEELKSTVISENADVGIAFDGDADRIGVINEKGERIEADIVLLLLARQLLAKKPNSKILFEVKCSMALIEDIKAHKGIPVMYRTGHSYIKQKMQEEKIPLGGEMSGHTFFAYDYYGFDDAIYAACKLLELLSFSDKSLSEMLADVPKYFSTPEIRVNCADEKKFEAVEKLRKSFRKEKGVELIEIDGIRVQYSDGWGLMRASNTQPALILRFEAKTPERLEEIKDLFRQKLKELKGFEFDF